MVLEASFKYTNKKDVISYINSFACFMRQYNFETNPRWRQEDKKIIGESPFLNIEKF